MNTYMKGTFPRQIKKMEKSIIQNSYRISYRKLLAQNSGPPVQQNATQLRVDSLMFER